MIIGNIGIGCFHIFISPFPIPCFAVPPFPHWLLAASTLSHFLIIISPFPVPCSPFPHFHIGCWLLPHFHISTFSSPHFQLLNFFTARYAGDEGNGSCWRGNRRDGSRRGPVRLRRPRLAAIRILRAPRLGLAQHIWHGGAGNSRPCISPAPQSGNPAGEMTDASAPPCRIIVHYRRLRSNQ